MAAPQTNRTLQEVSSSVYPKLERVPGKQNWVDKAGGLPSYIERIAKHIHYENGKSISTAIAMAVNTVKRWATGTNHDGSKLKPETVAKAQAAVAEWEAKKGKAKGKSLAEAYAEAPEGIEPDGEIRASLAGTFSHRLTLVEGFALNLKGSKTRGKAPALDSAVALLEGREVKLTIGRSGNADPRVMARAQSALGAEAAELRSTLDSFKLTEAAAPQVEAAQRDAKRMKAKGRSGQAVFDESKHPRAGKGNPAGGQFIRKGATGSEVKGIQRRLGVKTDGKFGNRTKEAVEAFQRKHNLEVDGVVGAQTAGALRGAQAVPGPLLSHHRSGLRKLKEDTKDRYSPDALAAADAAEKAKNKRRKAAKEAKKEAKSSSSSSSSSGSSSSSSTPSGVGATLGPDSSLPEKVVQLIQRKLGIDTSGSYDETTEQAIRKFQRENGLLVDGIVGTQTLAALRGDDSPPEPGAFNESDWSWLTQHQSGGQREKRHERQKKHRDERQQEREEKREQRELSSKRVAEAMVKDDFVRRYGSGMTGAPDEATGHLQRRLTELGYEPGADDGRYGEKTKGAVSKFQGEHGLNEDGEVGHDTKLALRGTDPEEVARRRTESEESGEQPKDDKAPEEKETAQEAEGETPASEEDEAEAGEAKTPSSSHSLAGAVLTKGAGVDSEQPDPSVEQMQSIIGSEVDGRFGPETEKKLKSTQRRYGLKPDGVVGPKTGRLLDRMATKHKPDPKKMKEAALDAAILDRMEAGASGDSAAFTRARAREERARQQITEATGFGPRYLSESLRDDLIRSFYRLDDGTFAPKGMGRILKPGEEIRLPHQNGEGSVRARIEPGGNKGRGIARILDGPDEGQLAAVRTAAPAGTKPRSFPRELSRRPAALPPGDPSSGAKVQEVKSQNYRDAINHHISTGEDHAVQDHLDDMESDHKWAERQGYGKATANYDAAKAAGEHFLTHGEAPEPQRAPIDFSTKSESELGDLAASISDEFGVPRSNVRDRSIFQAIMGERRRRAQRAYREAKGEQERSRLASVVAQLTGRRPEGAPALAQAAPPESFTPNAGEKQMKEMGPGDTFYVGKHDTAYKWHKPTGSGPFIIAKPLDGGKAKVFHEEFAPPFIGPSVADAAPDPVAASAGDDLYDKLKASISPKTGPFGKGAPGPPLSEPPTPENLKASPARSPSGNLRNFKAMSDKKLTALAEEMKEHSYDIAAIHAIVAELKVRGESKVAPPAKSPVNQTMRDAAKDYVETNGPGMAPYTLDQLGSGKHPIHGAAAAYIEKFGPGVGNTTVGEMAGLPPETGKPKMSAPKTAEPAKVKSADQKIKAAWGAYDKKKAEFDALPADADKATRSKLASQVRAAKFRIKRVGGDPDKPPEKAAAPAPPKKAAKKAPEKKAPAPKPAADEGPVTVVRASKPEPGHPIPPPPLGLDNMTVTAEKIGLDWTFADVAKALDKLETSGLVFDREHESPDTLAAVIKAASLNPADLKTIGTKS